MKTDAPVPPDSPAQAAITLRATLDDAVGFTPAEGAMLREWLDRIAGV